MSRLLKNVYVYRNLAGDPKRKKRPLYSVMKNGRVVAQRRRLILVRAKFKVRPAGRLKVLREGRKNVHAFVVGDLVLRHGAFGQDANGGDFPLKIYYSPYTHGYFHTREGKPVNCALGVLLNERGMSATYTDAR